MAVIDTSNGRGDGSQKTAKRMVGGDRSSKPPIGSSIAEKRMTKRDSLNSEERAAVDKKLLSCSEIGDARGAKSALEEGADANAKGAYGKTAFITACISNNMELAKALVKAEVDVNAKDEEGRAALLYAVFGKNAPLAKFLLESGATADTADVFLNTPLRVAIRDKDWGLAALLKKHGALSADEQERLNEKLFDSIKKNDLALASEAILEGADVGAWKQYEGTPLECAARAGNVEMGKLLLQNGADVNSKRGGCYALGSAAASRSYEFAEFLIGAGAKINAEDEHDNTALDYALWDARMMDLLEKHGAILGD